MGYVILAEHCGQALLKCKNPERAGRSSQLQYLETIFDEEGRVEGSSTPAKVWKLSKCSRQPDWLAYADVEMQKAYGSALMSGHGTLSLLFDL